MRKIFISDLILVDERLLRLAGEAGGTMHVLLWPYFLLTLDDWGRGSANPAILKARGAPAWDGITREHFAAAVEAYGRAGLVTLYQADGARLAAVPAATWFRYQTHIRAEKRENDGSRFPAPDSPGATRADVAQPLEDDAPPAPLADQPREDARDCAQVREDARECAQNRASPSPSPSPSLRATRARPRPSPETRSPAVAHPNAPYMAAFADAMGEARTPVEVRRRALAANDLRAGEVSVEDVRMAIERWPDVFGDAACTAQGIAANVATLLQARARRRPAGQVDATREWLSMASGQELRNGTGPGALGKRVEPVVGGLPAPDDRGGPDGRPPGLVGAGAAPGMAH